MENVIPSTTTISGRVSTRSAKLIEQIERWGKDGRAVVIEHSHLKEGAPIDNSKKDSFDNFPEERQKKLDYDAKYDALMGIGGLTYAWIDLDAAIKKNVKFEKRGMPMKIQVGKMQKNGDEGAYVIKFGDPKGGPTRAPLAEWGKRLFVSVEAAYDHFFLHHHHHAPVAEDEQIPPEAQLPLGIEEAAPNQHGNAAIDIAAPIPGAPVVIAPPQAAFQTPSEGNIALRNNGIAPVQKRPFDTVMEEQYKQAKVRFMGLMPNSNAEHTKAFLRMMVNDEIKREVFVYIEDDEAARGMINDWMG